MSIPDDILTTMKPQPYDEVRRQVQDGDLMLCSAWDPMSRMIRWATKSPWSHIGMVLRADHVDRVLVLECVAKLGTRAVALSDFISRTSSGITPYPGKILAARHDGLKDGPQPEKLKLLCEYAMDRLGTPFSNKEVAKIAARIAAGRLNIKMPGHLMPDDEFICSEYVARCYARAGLTIPWDGLGFIAPSDFAADPAIRPVAQVQTE
jgi:hypothetical protein